MSRIGRSIPAGTRQCRPCRIVSAKTPLLSIPSFADQAGAAISSIVARHARDIAQRPNLIIDVRGNTAGRLGLDVSAAAAADHGRHPQRHRCDVAGDPGEQRDQPGRVRADGAGFASMPRCDACCQRSDGPCAIRNLHPDPGRARGRRRRARQGRTLSPSRRRPRRQPMREHLRRVPVSGAPELQGQAVRPVECPAPSITRTASVHASLRQAAAAVRDFALVAPAAVRGRCGRNSARPGPSGSARRRGARKEIAEVRRVLESGA